MFARDGCDNTSFGPITQAADATWNDSEILRFAAATKQEGV